MIIKTGNISWDNYHRDIQSFIKIKMLSNKDQCIAQLSALIASGNFELLAANRNEFKTVFVDEEIIELSNQISYYTGIFIIKSVADIFDIKDFTPKAGCHTMSFDELHNQGVAFTTELDIYRRGKLNKPNETVISEIISQVNTYLNVFLYSNIYNDNKRERAITLISLLTALPNAETQFEIHIKTAINLGLDKNEIAETVLCCLSIVNFPSISRRLRLIDKYFSNS